MGEMDPSSSGIRDYASARIAYNQDIDIQGVTDLESDFP